MKHKNKVQVKQVVNKTQRFKQWSKMVEIRSTKNI